MQKFVKKPVVIEAIQYDGANITEIETFVGGKLPTVMNSNKDAQLVVSTLEGDMKISKDDWVIKGVKGEFYPCKPDIFEKTYDAETTSFKERLIKEHEELSDKLNKLYTFGSTEKFKELDPIHQQLLIIQSGSMATYNETLKLRLGLL